MLHARCAPLCLWQSPPEKSKKLPVLQLQAVILQLCAGRWLSTSELAALVDRDGEKLRSRFLTAMVKSGVPELRYPDDHHGPDQVYRVVQGDAAVGEWLFAFVLIAACAIDTGSRGLFL